MNAETFQEALDGLKSAGLWLNLTPDCRVRVTPASKLTDRLRRLIRTFKTQIVQQLARQAEEAQTEAVQERAAIMEFDAKLPPAVAQRCAECHTRYWVHLLNCSLCIAAEQGQGERCKTGAVLWLAYEEAVPA